ncbi:putative nuclease HARBI1 [Photinus pyralis]|uniref:putative nuclease HARBI1 n=1 Tax=Photinus pyralis TaxID=7054 RepID=UPI001267392B|nr:putative nuclease HARBI1 [Photinus pyralis]
MYFHELDDEIEMQEIEDLGLNRQRYMVRERQDNFHGWNEEQFFNRFRVTKNTALHINGLIEDNIRHRTDRNHAVSPLQQLLVALRFYACGSFQIVAGDFGGLHRTTSGQIIRRVSRAIAELSPVYIKMPDTVEEMAIIKQGFYAIARFPRVIGAIDCTHIRIQNPGGEHAENFRNRKGFFSINVQAVCDANYKIRNIVCRWPGASHDSHIFRNSTIRMKFENNEMENSILLGDSGYPLCHYLITPINNPTNPAEHYFNECQIGTRTIIERTFGIWKRKFPILSLGLRNKLPMCQDIIVATAIIHNIARDQNEAMELDDIEIDQDNNVIAPVNVENNARQPYIDYFQGLL